MEDQLAYVLVTPHSIRKSRTGPILSRLISRSGLDLVDARMFAPSKELAHAYAATAITEDSNPRHRATQELIRQYILQQFVPDADGHKARCLVLVFRGKEAVIRVMNVVGHIVHERTSAETIRDTYGDYIVDASGNCTYFEPAVLAAPSQAAVESGLKLWASYSDSDGGVLDDVIPFPADAQVEKTLVLIKPDNFRFPNARPGGVIDLFSRTGLSIICFRVLRMSVAQAEEFYGPVLPVLQDKLKERSGKEARLLIEREMDFPLPADAERQLGELLGPINGRNNWETLVQFMSGKRPRPMHERDRTAGAGYGEVRRDRVPGRGCRAQNPRGAWPHRSQEGANRHDPQGIRPDDHDQRRACERFEGKRRARDENHPHRGKSLPHLDRRRLWQLGIGPTCHACTHFPKPYPHTHGTFRAIHPHHALTDAVD